MAIAACCDRAPKVWALQQKPQHLNDDEPLLLSWWHGHPHVELRMRCLVEDESTTIVVVGGSLLAALWSD